MSDMGASCGPGSREPDPQAVPALPGFDPSREPEQARLAERFLATETRVFHADWTEEGALLSPEEKAAMINRVLDEIDHPIFGLVAELKGEAGLFRDTAHPAFDTKRMQPLPLTGAQKSAGHTADLLERAASMISQLASDSDGSPEGEKPQALSAKHDSAGRQASPNA